MNHQNYWEDKDERTKRARRWVDFVNTNYRNYIDAAINNSVIYRENFAFTPSPVENIRSYEPCDVKVMVTDSVSGVFKAIDLGARKPCVLNFASYKEPGGMFLNGSKAQEECLCHESTLYPVLNAFNESYYKDNAKAKNKALYLDRAIYSPGIVFIRGDQAVLSDAITCAAPNYTAAKKYCNVSEEENYKALYHRCRFVLDAMLENGVDVPILGAYGAGVFGQDADLVANIFKAMLCEPKYNFKFVVFAVIAGPNADAFLKVFKEENSYK